MKGIVSKPLFRGQGELVEDTDPRTRIPGKTYTFSSWACLKNGTNSGHLQTGADVWFGGKKDGTCAWVSYYALTPEQERQLQHLVEQA
jgi:hypothetical protein